MTRSQVLFALLFLALPSLAAAQTTPTTPATTVPAMTADAAPLPAVPIQQIGNLYVRKYGSGKQAVILIPGLACGAWVWDQTVRDFQNDETLYTVTLAGFDGTKPPADQDALLDQDVTGLSQLIASEKLVKPIIVGHSLGGHLALRLAAKQSDRLGGVLIVDSLPLFPPLQPGETLDQRKQSAPAIAAQLTSAPDAAYAAQEHQSCAYLVTDPKTADAVADKCLTSDRATVARAMSQMMSTDVGPELPKITVPVLVLTPSPSAGSSDYVQAAYSKAYAGTPHLRVQVVMPSRHFIMLDQPAQFEAALRAFLTDPNTAIKTP